jgi:hypothetical protein
MQKNFSLAESFLRDKFLSIANFHFNGIDHELLLCGKPSPSTGECKTDIYISAKNSITQEIIEIKISLKLDNYEFLENKISEETAKIIFGQNDYKDIIIGASKTIKDRFLKKVIIKTSDQIPSLITKIPLGWKIELFHKTKRSLNAELKLSLNQKIDILAGTNRPELLKNSSLDGKTILNSGVANYILVLPSDPNKFINKEMKYFLDKLEPIVKFAEKTDINAGFTCLNYFPKDDKWDGDRPLAVWINWAKDLESLKGELILDQPFARNGNAAAEAIKKIL